GFTDKLLFFLKRCLKSLLRLALLLQALLLLRCFTLALFFSGFSTRLFGFKLLLTLLLSLGFGLLRFLFLLLFSFCLLPLTLLLLATFTLLALPAFQYLRLRLLRCGNRFGFQLNQRGINEMRPINRLFFFCRKPVSRNQNQQSDVHRHAKKDGYREELLMFHRRPSEVAR